MLYFVTENKDKIASAKLLLGRHGIEIESKSLPLIEIQSDSQEEIAIYKAEQAFEQLRQPLLVKDDGWYISALNGFPGVYMKYVNQWFTAEDFLNLLQPYSNRDVIFKEAVCYIDKFQKKIFIRDVKGTVLKEPKGKGKSSARVISFREDQKTMAECLNEGIHFVDEGESIWHEFAQWYKP